MSVFMVLNQYLYGFVYIDCFYPMNIYKSLYTAIIDDKKTDFPNHRIFDPLFSYLGVIVLSFCIAKEKNEKIRDSKRKNSALSINLIHEDLSTSIDNKNCLSIFIKVLILWIIEENLLIIYVDIFQDLDFWFFELIIVSYIFSRNFIFKIYSHQKLGMAISIGIGSLLKIYNITMSITSIKNEEDNNLYQKYPALCILALFYFVLIYMRSYVNTKLKALMDLKFVSHRALFLCYGLVGFTICVLTGILTSLIPCFDSDNNKFVCKITSRDRKFFDEFLNYYESGKNFLVRLIIIVLGAVTFFFNKYYCTMIIKFYTPIHVIFSFPVQYFIEKNFLLIFTSIFFSNDLFTKENQLQKFLLDVFGDVASIIGFLIYLEIIELNFCGFNYNLAKNIINRGEDDYKISLSTDAKIRESNLSTLMDETVVF